MQGGRTGNPLSSAAALREIWNYFVYFYWPRGKGSLSYYSSAYTVSIQSFTDVILNNLEGRKRACVLMFIRWHQHHGVDSVGTCVTPGYLKESIRPKNKISRQKELLAHQ